MTRLLLLTIAFLLLFAATAIGQQQTYRWDAQRGEWVYGGYVPQAVQSASQPTPNVSYSPQQGVYTMPEPVKFSRHEISFGYFENFLSAFPWNFMRNKDDYDRYRYHYYTGNYYGYDIWSQLQSREAYIDNFVKQDGWFQLSYLYSLTRGWQLGASFDFSYSHQTIRNTITRNVIKTIYSYYVGFAPTLRYNYLRNNYCSVYSQIGLRASTNNAASVEYVLLGWTLGDKVFISGAIGSRAIISAGFRF